VSLGGVLTTITHSLSHMFHNLKNYCFTWNIVLRTVKISTITQQKQIQSAVCPSVEYQCLLGFLIFAPVFC